MPDTGLKTLYVFGDGRTGLSVNAAFIDWVSQGN
jgi:hypothetical protein